MNNNYKEDILDGLITAVLRQFAIEEVDNAPSDEELVKTFPPNFKHKRLLRKYVKREKHLRAQPLPLIYLKRAAIIVLSVITISFGLLMTNIEVRAAVKKAVVEFFDKYVRISFTDSETNDINAISIDSFMIEYIPNGFLTVDEYESDDMRAYTYSNDEDKYLTIIINLNADAEDNIDIEENDFSRINIGEYECFLLYNADGPDGTIVFSYNNYSFSVSGLLERDELIKVVENIKIKKS